MYRETGIQNAAGMFSGGVSILNNFEVGLVMVAVARDFTYVDAFANQHVTVGMRGETALERDRDPAEHHRVTGLKPVRIVTLSYAHFHIRP